MYDFIQQLAYPSWGVLERFHIDVSQGFLKEKSKRKKWKVAKDIECLIPKYLNIDVDERGLYY